MLCFSLWSLQCSCYSRFLMHPGLSIFIKSKDLSSVQKYQASIGIIDSECKSTSDARKELILQSAGLFDFQRTFFCMKHIFMQLMHGALKSYPYWNNVNQLYVRSLFFHAAYARSIKILSILKQCKSIVCSIAFCLNLMIVETKLNHLDNPLYNLLFVFIVLKKMFIQNVC